MKKVELALVKHDKKVGGVCEALEPNISEDTLFFEDGEIVGFYIRSIKDHSPKLAKLADIANMELRSDRVPKSVMKRSSGLHNQEAEVLQYSTIIGSVPPKPHMRRPYPTMSSVHRIDSARTFVKAMLGVCKESELLIKKIAPAIYKKQKELIKQNVPQRWRLGELFTSSISNYNISANYHTDKANIKGAVNVIISKRHNTTGGHTTIPDYGATVHSDDGSMLVYPAWRNLHAVTPIVQTARGGYRNTLVFYPLKAFKSHG